MVIRGAGNLLGSEQSGFISDLGYETYQKILNQAMAELRNESIDHSPLTIDHSTGQKNAVANNVQCSMFNVHWVDDCALESDIEMFFPEQYVPNDSERMLLYRELDNLANRNDLEAAIEAYRNRLRDRFGEIPEVAEELIRVVPLRVLGKRLGVEKIMLKQQKMYLYFVSNPDSPYYQSEIFGRVLNYLTHHVRRCSLREANSKRSMVVSDIVSVNDALTICRAILTE